MGELKENGPVTATMVVYEDFLTYKTGRVNFQKYESYLTFYEERGVGGYLKYTRLRKYSKWKIRGL